MNTKLKTLGLVFALSCVFATGSASAQAAAHWNVGGSPLPSGSSEAIAETVSLTKFGTETTPTLVFTIEGLTRIACSGLKINEGKIIGPSTDKANYLLLTECSVQNTKGEPQPKCTIKSEGGTVGTIRTTALSSAVKVVNGKSYDIFTPAAGTTIATVVVGAVEGGSCSLSGTNKWTGTMGFELPVGTNSSTLEMTSSAAIQTAAGASFSNGSRNIVLDLKADLQLTSGKTFGVGL